MLHTGGKLTTLTHMTSYQGGALPYHSPPLLNKLQDQFVIFSICWNTSMTMGLASTDGAITVLFLRRLGETIQFFDPHQSPVHLNLLCVLMRSNCALHHFY